MVTIKTYEERVLYEEVLKKEFSNITWYIIEVYNDNKLIDKKTFYTKGARYRYKKMINTRYGINN